MCHVLVFHCLMAETVAVVQTKKIKIQISFQKTFCGVANDRKLELKVEIHSAEITVSHT